MEEFSRPATLEDLKTLIRALNEQGANLEGLLRTKQSVCSKDVADREILERALDAYRALRG